MTDFDDVSQNYCLVPTTNVPKCTRPNGKHLLGKRVRESDYGATFKCKACGELVGLELWE